MFNSIRTFFIATSFIVGSAAHAPTMSVAGMQKATQKIKSLVLQGATPTAISILLIAEANNKDQNIAASLVMFSSLISVMSIPAWIFISTMIEISLSSEPLKNHSPGGNTKSPVSHGSINRLVFLNLINQLFEPRNVASKVIIK